MCLWVLLPSFDWAFDDVVPSVDGGRGGAYFQCLTAPWGIIHTAPILAVSLWLSAPSRYTPLLLRPLCSEFLDLHLVAANSRNKHSPLPPPSAFPPPPLPPLFPHFLFPVCLSPETLEIPEVVAKVTCHFYQILLFK